MANSTSTFASGGGKVTTDFGGTDYGMSMTVQSDGKILLAGVSDNTFALARYNTDGSLDTTFSGDGKVTTSFNGNNIVYGVTVQPDGKILETGTNGHFASVRYNPDGSLDTSFSDDGKVTTSFGMYNDGAGGVTVLPGGKILEFGLSFDANHNGNIALVRYNADGSLDTSFSGDGMVTTDLGYDENPGSMVVQTDGKILVAGGTWWDYNSSNFFLIRYNADGSLDTGFSSDGIVMTSINNNLNNEGFGGIALQRDGKILAVGESNGDFVLVRYNSDGSLDGSFSGDGIVTTDLGKHESGWAVTVQSNGKILIAGSTATSGGGFTWEGDTTIHLVEGNSDFALVRYNADGSLDTSFGNGGKVTTDFGGNDVALSVAVLADGKIVVSGISNGDFALARYNSDGSLDTSTSFAGTSGDDTFHNSTGNEAFNGGAGVDTVIFSGHESNYTISLAGAGFSLKDNVGTDGIDTVVNIEKLQFTDHTLTIAAVPTEILLESYRIYKAAFDRAPDYGGLGYWFNVMGHGASLTDIAGGFIGSNEFKAMYGDNPTDSTFVSLLYHHVLGRDLDQGGYDFWMNDLKVETRAQVLAHFSESTENIANVAGVIANGIIYEVYAG